MIHPISIKLTRRSFDPDVAPRITTSVDAVHAGHDEPHPGNLQNPDERGQDIEPLRPPSSGPLPPDPGGRF